MTEKRFNMEYVHGNTTIWHITDCGEHIPDEKLCDLLNELNDENEQLKKENKKLKQVNEMLQMDFAITERNLMEENEKLKSVIKEVTELLSDEVDLFSDKATEHDIIAYVELKELDNKDAYYMATATKKAIRMLKELQE